MIIIKINTGNSAFETEEDYNTETGRILRELANKFEHGYYPVFAHDINGNKCTTIEYEQD